MPISGQPYADFGTANVGASLAVHERAGPADRRGAQAAAPAHARRPGGGLRDRLRRRGPAASWGAWISGLGGFGSVGGNANAGTLTYNLGGAAVGVDYRLDPRFLVGLGGRLHERPQWVNGFKGNGNSDNYSAALYASFNAGRSLRRCAGGLRL